MTEPNVEAGGEKATHEDMIYDAMISIYQNSGVIAALATRAGTDTEKEAYKRGMYAPCIKLQMILGPEAIERGRVRYAKLKADAEAYFASLEKPL